jgi:CDP-diacylglycerol--serine O-phosphatidyltransferase
MNRAFRYLAPNLITASGIVFGLLSLEASHHGRYAEAAWFIIYAVLTDRLDGFVARLVRGTSELGVQLDSLADFLTFGLAPAVLMFFSLGDAPGLAFQAGNGRAILMGACACWVLAACFRLARYNISSEGEQTPRVFFGVPTTLAAGTLVIWFLTLLKYAGPDSPLTATATDEARLLGSWTTPVGVWQWTPLVLFVGAFLMASNLRMPKLGLATSKVATAFIMVNVAAGYVCGTLRIYPDYMLWPPTMWLVVFLAWGQVSPTARQMRPPPIFPVVDPPEGHEPRRPEDDMLTESEVGSDEFQF